MEIIGQFQDLWDNLERVNIPEQQCRTSDEGPFRVVEECLDEFVFSHGQSGNKDEIQLLPKLVHLATIPLVCVVTDPCFGLTEG